MHQLLENMDAKLSQPVGAGADPKSDVKALTILLDESIRSSSVVDDPHRANVRCVRGKSPTSGECGTVCRPDLARPDLT
jgi:hypothetical protein